MSYQHLKDRSYYEEMYDRHTVERCRWHEEPRPLSGEENDARKGLTSGQIQWSRDFASDWLLFQLVGDRWLQREKSIEEWIERDKQRDIMLERAQKPLIRCPKCSRVMECVYTHVNFDIDNSKREWVEFFIACKACKESKTVHENGQEIPDRPSLCVKCNKAAESSTKKKGGKEYFVDTCKHCGHVEETVSVLDKGKKAPTSEEIEKFEYDKKRFCLSSTQGERYKLWVDGMKRMGEEKKEQEANAEYYDKLADVKKINIAGLEKLLKAAIKKTDYVDLNIFMQPPDRQIILNFSVRDTQEKRPEYDSRKTLEKIIENALEDKNWALMSDDIHYRLGFLSGRIRGYETEEDLQELTKSRMKKKGKQLKLSKPREYTSMLADDIEF